MLGILFGHSSSLLSRRDKSHPYTALAQALARPERYRGRAGAFRCFWRIAVAEGRVGVTWPGVSMCSSVGSVPVRPTRPTLREGEETMFSRFIVATDLSPASFAVVDGLGGLRAYGARQCLLLLLCLSAQESGLDRAVVLHQASGGNPPRTAGDPRKTGVRGGDADRARLSPNARSTGSPPRRTIRSSW